MNETPKKPRGRPKSTAPASVVLPPIRCTPDQKQRWSDAAAKVGKSLSAWLKDLADRNA